MIKKLTYENFKGLTGSQELTGFDLFIGENGSGKSARAQVPALTTQGYVPGNGKEESATFNLSSSDTQMSVGMTMETSFSCVRKFTKTSKTKRKTGEIEIKVSQEINFSPSRGETTLGQKKERIAGEIGNFAAMFDFDEFLSLSGAGRRKFINNLAPIDTDKWSKAIIQAHLEKNLLTAVLEKNNLDQFKIMKALIDQIMTKFPEGFSAQDGLQAMIGWLKTEKSFWDGKADDAQGAINQIAEKKNESDQNDRDLMKYKAERDLLGEERISLEKKISTGQERQKAISKREARIKEINESITALENEEISTETFDLDTQIEGLRAQLNNTNYSEQYESLKQSGTTKKAQAESLKQVYESLVDKKRNFEAQYSSLKKSMETVEGCKGSCVIDPERVSCPKDFVDFREFVAQKSAESEKFFATIQIEIDKAAEQYQAIEKELLEITNDMTATNDLQSKANEANRKINEQIAELDRQRNDRLNAIKNRDEKVLFYRNELVPLNSAAMAESPLEDLTQSETRITEIKNRLETLKGLIDSAEKAKEDLLLIQRNLLENREAQYKSNCLKSIDEELGAKGVQGEIVKETIGPLKSSTQQYLGLMGYDYPVFFETESETGQEIFRFGWVKGGRRIYFDTLSTGQQIIYLAALVTVIVDRANPKTRILAIDKLDNLDKYNFQLVMAGLAKLKPQYDNIMLAGDVKGELVFPGKWEYLSEFEIGECKVWNLTPKEVDKDDHVQQSA